VLGLGGLHLQVSRNEGSTSVASVINGPPEAFVAPGPALLDMDDGGAITNDNLGKLTLGQLGSLPEGGKLGTEGSAQLGDCL
jgi:hypothetical protein